MRIYSTELLAAAAFIASISSYSASGSEIAQPELPTSDLSHDREDGVMEEQALRTKDEAEREARMQPPSEMSASTVAAKVKLNDIPGNVATAVQTQLAQLDDRFAEALKEHPELSETAAKGLAQDPKYRRDVPPQTTGGALLSEADILKIFERARAHPQFLNSESLCKLNKEVPARNAESSTPFTLLDLLILIYRADQGDFIELVSALSKAKAGEIISKNDAYALEEMMLQYWKADGVSFILAYDFLGLSDLAERGDLMDKNLDLLQRYYTLCGPDLRGNILDLYAYVRFKIGDDKKLFQMTVKAGGESSFANEMLAYFVTKGIEGTSSPKNILQALLLEQMNDVVAVRLLTKVCVNGRVKSHQNQKKVGYFDDNAEQQLQQIQTKWVTLMTMLKDELVSRWLNNAEMTPERVLSLLELTDPSSVPEEEKLVIFRMFVEGYNKKTKTGTKVEEMYTNKRMTPAESHQERAPKRQRIEGPTILR